MLWRTNLESTYMETSVDNSVIVSPFTIINPIMTYTCYHKSTKVKETRNCNLLNFYILLTDTGKCQISRETTLKRHFVDLSQSYLNIIKMACGRTNHRNYRVIVSHRRMSEDQNGTAHSPGTQILCMLSVFRTSLDPIRNE
jgi:hypothetical protein